MNCGDRLKTILTTITVILITVMLIVIVLAVSGCGKTEDPPKQYAGRMKFAGWSDYDDSELLHQIAIWIDTETGVCYAGRGGSLTVLVDHDGKPYVANGWRDYGSED